jgi:putative flavoprotein involved in K+ transport
MSPIDAVVIGGGQYGLAASWHLTDRGIEHVVLERGEVAQTWRSERWDSFALNTPTWMNRMPGDPDDVEPRDAFLTRDGVVQMFETYAERHRLPVRTSAAVTAVEPGRRTGTFIVSTAGKDGDGGEAIEARHVVVASGAQPRPRRPILADHLPDTVHQLHSVEYRSPAVLPGGAVLVVGSAQSGVQIAEDLVEAGRTVYLCTSRVGRLRRRQRGRDSLDWLVRVGFYDQTPEQLPDPALMALPIPQISGVGPLGHTVGLQSLEALGVRLLGRPVGVAGDRIALDDSLGANIAFGDRVSAELNAIVERGMRELGETRVALEPDAADEPHPDPTSVHAPSHVDLEAQGISSIIWATGYAADFGFLRVPVLDERGAPIHDRGAARVPGIHFLGLRWLTKRKSALLNAADEESAALAARMAGALAK